MARVSSVVSEADEEWGEDEEIVSTSSTEAVAEAIPFTRKESGLKLAFDRKRVAESCACIH